jgi:hypothetical protein
MMIELQDDTKDSSYYAAGLATYSIVSQLFLYMLRYLRTRSVKNKLESIRLENLIRPKEKMFYKSYFGSASYCDFRTPFQTTHCCGNDFAS